MTKAPKSASSPLTTVFSLLMLVLGLASLRIFEISDREVGFYIVCLTLFASIALPELIFLKVHRRLTTGMNWDKDANISFQRVLFKLLGLATCLSFVTSLYWVFPEYRGKFYFPYWSILQTIAPFYLVLAPLYFFLVDSKMRSPEDSYFLLGKSIVNRSCLIAPVEFIQLLLGWMVKGFFLPLMIIYLLNNIGLFIKEDFSYLTTFKAYYDLGFYLIFTIDLAYVVLGYILSLRIFDTHIRSVESSFLGWGIALLCYQPFWAIFGSHYLSYSDSFVWEKWLASNVWAYGLWGSAILLLIGIYSYSSACFGLRFSNLTNRGIITHGPYRFTKHPAYVTKCLSWWLIAIPFIVHDGLGSAGRQCIALALLCGVYGLRALTEERHLRKDPIYREYEKFIDSHGLFKFLKPIKEKIKLPDFISSTREN